MGAGDSPPCPYHTNRRGTAYLRGDTVLAIRRRAPTDGNLAQEICVMQGHSVFWRTHGGRRFATVSIPHEP